MSNPIPPDVQQLLQGQHSAEWNCGPERGNEGQSVRWVRVAELSSGKVTLGLSDTGYWVRGGGATVELGRGPEAITLLPCLECPLQELYDTLSRGLARIGLPAHLAQTFPVGDLVLCGLNSGSEYWMTLALNTAEQGVTSEEIRNALRAATDVAPTQKIRHRARALLAKSVN